MPTVEDGVEVYPYRPPRQQTDATLSQVNPASATLYTVLSVEATAAGTTPVRNVVIEGLYVETTGGTTSLLELVVTVDGKTIIFSINNPVSGTPYYPAQDPAQTDAAQGLQANNNTVTNLMSMAYSSGRSVLVQARVTWTVQPSPLEGRVKYARFLP